MAEPVSWTFHGYVTPAGRRDVADWFKGLDDDDRDEAIDTLAYLQYLPVHLWKEPEYKPLGEGLGEIRFKANDKVFRIYVMFWPTKTRYNCTLLFGTTKKVSNAASDKQRARNRKTEVENGTATVHEFKFS